MTEKERELIETLKGMGYELKAVTDANGSTIVSIDSDKVPATQPQIQAPTKQVINPFIKVDNDVVYDDNTNSMTKGISFFTKVADFIADQRSKYPEYLSDANIIPVLDLSNTALFASRAEYIINVVQFRAETTIPNATKVLSLVGYSLNDIIRTFYRPLYSFDFIKSIAESDIDENGCEFMELATSIASRVYALAMEKILLRYTLKDPVTEKEIFDVCDRLVPLLAMMVGQISMEAYNMHANLGYNC